MTVRLITATAVLLLALMVASSALAHSEKPPPKHGCRIQTHPTGHCFAVGRAGKVIAFQADTAAAPR
jgi:hypothetical protein